MMYVISIENKYSFIKINQVIVGNQRVKKELRMHELVCIFVTNIIKK